LKSGRVSIRIFPAATTGTSTGAILGMTEQQVNDRFDDIVEFSEIGQFIDTEVKFYSSGMYLRLAFSVAVHSGS